MPHLSSVPHDHDFLDMVAEIALRVKFDGIALTNFLHVLTFDF